MIAPLRGLGLPLAVSLASAALLLGPALGPGVTLAYDLGWSPDPRYTPFVTGSGMVAPRAVPSDAVGVTLGLVVGGAVAEKLVLTLVLVLCGLGPAVLLRRFAPAAPPIALAAAAVAGVWNPFVAERLAIGQWTILLGFGLTGFALAAVSGSAQVAGRDRLAEPVGFAGSTGLAGAAEVDGPADVDGLATTAPPRKRRAGLGPEGVVAVAGLGGANTVLMVTLAAVVGLMVGSGPRRWRRLGATVLVAAGVSAVWALPALAASARAANDGQLFAPASDTPLPVAISLLSGGGMWNAASHPAARAALPLAMAATALAACCAVAVARRARRDPVWRPLAAVGAVALVLVVGSASPGTDAAWADLAGAIPGGGLLRDSHKLLAPWVVLLAAGLGLLIARLWGPAIRIAGSGGAAGSGSAGPASGAEPDSGPQGAVAGAEATPDVAQVAKPASGAEPDSGSQGAGSRPDRPHGGPDRHGLALEQGVRRVGALALAALPVALLPTLAWGVAGRLDAVTVPDDYRATSTRLSAAPAGLVGVLPWNQYRRYPWNLDTISLSLLPRIVDQPVLQNDALPTRSGWVPGEDPRAARVSAAIAGGTDPVAALRAEGVRYVVIETDAAAPPDLASSGAGDPGAASGEPSAAHDESPLLASAERVAAGPSMRAYDLGPADDAQAEATGGPSWVAGWLVSGATWALVAAAVARGALTRLGARGRIG